MKPCPSPGCHRRISDDLACCSVCRERKPAGVGASYVAAGIAALEESLARHAAFEAYYAGRLVVTHPC